MVTINTQYSSSISSKYSNITFRHLVELPKSDCFFGSARDTRTGKLHLFLIVNHRGKIYARNGLNGTWVELKDPHEYDRVRRLVTSAVANQSVPCYSTRLRSSLLSP